MDIYIDIGGWGGYEKSVALPIKWNSLLDERLDECILNINNVTDSIFRIGDEVKIRIYPQIELDFIIASDTSTQVPAGGNRYNHELKLIEPTKILEGIVVETLAFAQPVTSQFLPETTCVSPSIDVRSESANIPALPSNAFSATGLPTPIRAGKKFVLPAIESIIGFNMSNVKFNDNGMFSIEVIPNGETTLIAQVNGRTQALPFLPQKDITYTVVYKVAIRRDMPDQVIPFYNYNATLTYKITAKEVENLDYTIASVIDRVLDLAEPHLTSVQPKYKLDFAQHTEFENIRAPEFAFTNKTLKEILDQIGGYIHGIPRLVRGDSGELDTIRFDILGSTKEASLADSEYKYVTQILSNNIENYATEIDSVVENLACLKDEQEGDLIEPFNGGWKSTRSQEEYARITDTNMIIETTLPVYKVNKAEVYVNGNVFDITNYIVEATDYARLSSYSGAYPHSKAFALYYTLGECNIQGLNFKSKGTLVQSNEDYAITNIIKAVSGVETNGNYASLFFRVNYVPLFAARIKQRKANYKSYRSFRRTLSYNQSANIVDTRSYGENLKGVIARIGNEELMRTYVLTQAQAKLIPHIGEQWRNRHTSPFGTSWYEEYYVSSVTSEIYADHIVCVIGLSQDYNRLSQYIGIDSEWRAYEVSEKNTYKRNYIYKDVTFIGFNAPTATLNDSYCIADTDKYLQALTLTFTQEANNLPNINVATLYNYMNSSAGTVALKSTITLPVISTVFGNSLSFIFGCKDNFSAGNKSENGTNDKISGYWQTGVQYVDYYGRIDYVDFKLSVDTQFHNSYAFDLPGVDTEVKNSNTIFSTSFADSSPKLELKKNGAEIMQYSYQMDFSTYDSGAVGDLSKEIIIGPALTHNNPLVRKTRSDHSAAIYILENKIGKFQTHIDVSTPFFVLYGKRTDLITVNIAQGGKSAYMKILDLGADKSGKAWAIADVATGEILLARNVDIKVNDTIKLPYLWTTHIK